MNRQRRQRGNTIIEATLTLGLFLTIVFGIFDFSWVMFQRQQLTHQARDAARWAAVNLNGANPPSGTLLAQIQNLAACGQTTACPSGIPIAADQITVTRTDIGTTQDRINITIPRISYTALVGTRLLGGSSQTTSLAPISVSLPVENTTPIANLPSPDL